MQDKYCPACGQKLKNVGIETIQLNRQKRKSLFSSRDRTLEADVYICSTCGKLERYNRAAGGEAPAPITVYDGVAPITCSRCGKTYEPAFGHCPCCGWVEEEPL